jgi:uncharacterized protein YlzI (FlbEa/FlbD family)
MIKLTITGANPDTMMINPIHLAEAIARPDHTSDIRLMNGNSYNVVESTEIIDAQMIAWQHRMHQ